MKDFFYAIQDLFVNTLFAPLDTLRSIELENWVLANIMSWVFFAIGMVAFIYWMIQLRKFDTSNEEDKSITSHSYL
ncbi:MAG: uracil phosphoribosyltransferase [Winogradskyella sp.]|nr:uracil phosphoribosyltransferase [Winogradskyella sp.]MBT8376438.1 uracil phosphoribosyltransferase [Bacteroidia bacterium]NNC45610.1 uracil phosphoribosyltransferase [Winogradskyella sp.]NNF85477.1 uracil phosphoribosyltransferase [Winogradskyella sp.]NNK39471.1 uracil phosphoribosyltransferase [Winogradskyella sp.]